MRAHSSSTIPRPTRRPPLPDHPRLPRVDSQPNRFSAEVAPEDRTTLRLPPSPDHTPVPPIPLQHEAPAPQLPKWLGSESDAIYGMGDLDGFHLGVQGPTDREINWEVCPAAGVRIGRSSGCNVVLPDSAVSRYHAEITRLRSGRYAVRDLKSQNGMRVNGKITRQWTLNDGDVVQIGAYTLTFGGGVLQQLPADLSVREVPKDGVYGRTFAMGEQTERKQSERSVNQRAFLQVIGDRHRLSGMRVCQYVIECDALVVGSNEDADLQLSSRLAPRICAVIVRSEGRFSLHPIAPWPFTPKLNGHRVQRPQLLDDLDELEIGGAQFRFRMGNPG